VLALLDKSHYSIHRGPEDLSKENEKSSLVVEPCCFQFARRGWSCYCLGLVLLIGSSILERHYRCDVQLTGSVGDIAKVIYPEFSTTGQVLAAREGVKGKELGIYRFFLRHPTFAWHAAKGGLGEPFKDNWYTVIAFAC
jgi:hypothetical protein